MMKLTYFDNKYVPPKKIFGCFDANIFNADAVLMFFTGIDAMNKSGKQPNIVWITVLPMKVT